ncbi:hypothetical protein AGMMS50256_03380 [Betaproteobacteria bacterium]|nr:hypothetical protein AGMMS50256_03380 [Betaproteobacteria bacterium]
MSKLGFVGLGIMGAPMAGHLIEGGHEVFLYSRRNIPEALVQAGGKACASGREVAQNADVIITMVQYTQYRLLPGTVQQLRRARRSGVGSLRHGARPRNDGQLRDRSDDFWVK